ncbi:hypothetical protein [Paenibacillus sp. NEAU-GSW1]|nr:hypothetical protein [Paenibacillus sp. NEAU-GSW1]
MDRGAKFRYFELVAATGEAAWQQPAFSPKKKHKQKKGNIFHGIC